MPYKFHGDPRKKWDQQYLTTKNYIIPFVSQFFEIPPSANILEVGCGEGGVLKAFSDCGFSCYGVDIASHRIEHANKLLANEVRAGKITFYAGDVHDTEQLTHLKGEIDLLILKDAIEHIHDQKKILAVLQQFIKKDGVAFVAFPPWHSPFGGHQQMAASKLKYTPWLHLLPKSLYQKILTVAGEKNGLIDGLMEIYETRLPLARFEHLLKETNWNIVKRQLYLLNPIYEYKFGIKGRRQFGAVTALPYLRDFVSTGAYYLLRTQN